MRQIINQNEKYMKAPFVAQTAYALVSDRKKIMEAGFKDFIAKPFDRKSLLEIVSKNLTEEA